MMNVNSDPMMALILAAHTRSQIAMEDLSGLAKDQKASNDLLKEIRGLENELRKARSDGRITRDEITKIEQQAAALQEKGVGIDISTQLAGLRGLLNVASSANGEGEYQSSGILASEADNGEHGYSTDVGDGSFYAENGEDYLFASAASPHENHKTNDKTLDAIKEAINDAKENVKAEVSNRELDIQRVTQEVSSAMQLQSNLSKRWSDVGNAIIGNMRA